MMTLNLTIQFLKGMILGHRTGMWYAELQGSMQHFFVVLIFVWSVLPLL